MKKASQEEIAALAKRLRAIGKKIPNINYGGCGVFAEALHAALAKSGIKSAIAIVSREGDGVIRSVNELNFAQFMHMVVRVDGKYLDSDGVYASNTLTAVSNSRAKYGFMADKLDVAHPKALKAMNRLAGEWNPMFDRTNIRRMRKMVRDAVDSAFGDAQTKLIASN